MEVGIAPSWWHQLFGAFGISFNPQKLWGKEMAGNLDSVVLPSIV